MPPKDIQTLEDRLKTRFESGLIADIQPPEYETRVAIIGGKSTRITGKKADAKRAKKGSKSDKRAKKTKKGKRK